jgi:acyl-CoA thioesterase-2
MTDPVGATSRSPYRARAWWGDVLVADSCEAMRVERPGEEPQLFFPVSDLRLDALTRDEAGGGHDPVVRIFDDASPELPWRAGHGVVDHHRARVELVDERPGDLPEDVTVKRFPTWGDAADLVQMLDVEPDGRLRYLGRPRTGAATRVVEGSQLLGQSVVAASKHAPGRRVVSAHMVFTRAASHEGVLEFDLDEHAAQRTMTTLGVRAVQSGRLLAVGTVLLDVGAPDVIRHAVVAPRTRGPYESEPFDMSVTGRDLRIVDGAYTSDRDAPVGPPILDAWVRFRDVPSTPSLHAGLVAQFTGHLSIAAALRPHAGIGEQDAHRTLSTAINAISLSFHAEVRADEWLLYRHRSTSAGDGMTRSECRVHTEAGDLVASFAVDAMVRPFPKGARTVIDDRTTL